ncbi:AbrB/MazE/SpoVT family DNA-binding domain-containing protein [Candidatus Korarchaeum cryptofilum]
MVIPKRMRERLGIEEGTVELEVVEGALMLRVRDPGQSSGEGVEI